METARAAIEALTLEALAAIRESPFGLAGCTGFASYDSRRDKLVSECPTFQPAVEAIAAIPNVEAFFSASVAPRLAIQFVFNTCRLIAGGISPDQAFAEVWKAFCEEVDTPTWNFAAVANIQNLQCSEDVVILADGISVRARSEEDLSPLLKWGRRQFDLLYQDWEQGAASSFVLLVQKNVPKTPDNFMAADDGTAYARAARALLAMRLHAPGDVRIGRMFLARPMAFNVGLGGMQSLGFSVWHPGRPYELTSDQVPHIRQLYAALSDFESRAIKTYPNIALALRSFAAIYDRFFHQGQDRVIDAVTAFEALLKVNAELSFRTAFRTASLLALSDDERVSLYRTVTEYYRIRNTLVHGGTLNEEQQKQLLEDEHLRAVLRRILKAFLHLAVHPGDWTLKRLYDDFDFALLHVVRREALQSAMSISPKDVV